MLAIGIVGVVMMVICCGVLVVGLGSFAYIVPEIQNAPPPVMSSPPPQAMQPPMAPVESPVVPPPETKIDETVPSVTPPEPESAGKSPPSGETLDEAKP